MDNKKLIQEKVKVLIAEGYKPSQAFIIASNMVNKEHAQQGGQPINSNLKPIYDIKQGVSNPALGEGVYIYYKDPTQHGFSPSHDREFVNQEAFQQTVLKTPAFQQYSRDKASGISFVPPKRVEDDFAPTQPTSNLKPIVQVQSGVSNNKLGNGVYIYYKDRSDPSFNVNTDRDFVTDEAFQQTVLRSPSYQQYSRNKQYQSGGYYNQYNTPFMNNYSQGMFPYYDPNDINNLTLPKRGVNETINTNIDNQQLSPGLDMMEYSSSLEGAMLTPQGENLRYNTEMGTVGQNPNVSSEGEEGRNYYDTNRVNIMNPYGGVDLNYALNYAGQGFGSKNYGQAAMGTGLSILKGARSFMSGFGTGRENKRIEDEYLKKRFADNRFPTYLQAGGVKNSDVIAQNAITNDPSGNTNLEGNEFVKRTDGQVQPVVGDKHIENGKIGNGVDANLNDGDKVLSDYVKLKATDIKDLKERYNISLKTGATFAQAQKKIDQKLGIKKLEDEKAEILEKIEKASNIKDENTKQLSLDVLGKKMGGVNEKLNSLGEVRADNFEYLFQKQESQPKQGNGNQIFDKNGKEVTEYAEGGEKESYQQGGTIENLANKHGISVERAHELMSMQQGGEQQASQEQMIQQVAQALQSGEDPNTVIEMLIQQGLGHEQAMQVVEGIMQQMQGAPQEQVVPQEESMQMGGEKEYGQSAGEWVYNIETGKNEYKTNKREGQHAVEGQAYGSIDPEKALQFLRNNFPDIIDKEFKDNIKTDEQGNVTFKKNISLDKEQEAVKRAQELINSRMKNSADVILSNPSRFNPEMVKEAQRYKDEETFLEGDALKKSDENSVRGFDAKAGQFTSGRYSMGLDLMTPEDQKKLRAKGISTLKQLKGSDVLKDLSPESKKRVEDISKLVGDKDADFSIAEFSVPKTETPAVTSQNQEQVEARTITKNVMPNFGSYIPLFSAMQPIAKESINIPRLEPIKMTTEPFLAEQERQRQTDVARVQESGMSPQQVESLLAQGLSASQMASNDAIGKVEQYNAQNQFATDQYNVGAQTKEQIMNSQYNQDYQNKTFQTLANNEEQINNQYRTAFLQEEANRKYVDQLNKANMLSDQFALVPGKGIIPLNNKPFEMKTNFLPKSVTDAMSPEQYNAYKKQMALKGVQNQ